MTNRPVKKLGEIVKFSQGIQVPIEEQHTEKRPGFVRFLRIIDFTQGGQEHRYIENLGDRYFVNENELSMVRYGATTGFICTGKSGIIANNLFKISPTIDMNSGFIYYFFKSSIFQNYLNSAIFGAAMPAINFSGLNDLEIPLPPLATQQLIVAKLDETFAQIDEAITTTQANIDKTDELTKSVLDKVFEEGEWEKVKIGKIVEKTDTWNPLSKPNEKFNYVDISSIDNKEFKIIETKEIFGKDAPGRAKKVLLKGDILYATTRPNLKNIAVCNIEKQNLTASTGFCILRTKKDKLLSKYLFHYIVTDSFFKKIESYIRGAQYPAVSDSDIKNIEIILPSLVKQQEIVSYLDHVFAQSSQLKEQYQNKLTELKTLKASVLQSAFEGKLV